MTGNKNINVLPLDLQNPYSIRNFIKLISMNPVNVLINNAGIFPRYPKPVCFFENVDSVLATNFIGTFYLTCLLIPHLKRTAKDYCTNSRVIFVSSFLSSKGNFGSPEELFELSQADFRLLYANSKLACNLFARKLHQLFGSGRERFLDVFCTFTGGMINTNLSRDFVASYPFLIQYLLKIMLKLILKSPEEGCQSIVHCAVSNNILLAHQNESHKQVSKKVESDLLFSNCNPIKWPENSEDLELAERLWSFTLNFLRLSDSELLLQT